MIDKKLFAKYNKKDGLLIISEYGLFQKGSTGLSRFAFNTAQSLKRSRIIILANKIDGDSQILEDNNSLLIRCYTKNSPISLLNIFLLALKFNKVQSVLFEFEFASYGNILSVLIIPFIVFLMRLFCKRVFFAIHQVTDDLKRLHQHLGLEKRSPLLWFFNLGLGWFYFSLGIFSEKLIVLEKEFMLRLAKFVNKNKMVIIPHGVENISLPINLSKKNEFVILVFGYIAWYKGLDRLIDSFNNIPSKINGKTIRLVIAGGYSQAQAGKSHYDRYYQLIINSASKNKRIRVTGFVPEEKIIDYYAAADLCLVPYREFVSSSGPFSLALSFAKPIILSKELKDYTKSADFEKALALSGLNQDELFIEINPAVLKATVKKIIFDRKYQKQLINFSSNLRKLRSWNKISRQYNKIFIYKKKGVFLPKIELNLKHKNLQINYS